MIEIAALVRNQALLETIIDSAIASLNGVKTQVHATRTNSFKYTKFRKHDSLVIVAQSVRRWVDELLLISSADSMQAETFFLYLTTRVGRLFFFSLTLPIIFSSRSKSDLPSHENLQLKQATQNTIEQPGYRAHNSSKVLSNKKNYGRSAPYNKMSL